MDKTISKAIRSVAIALSVFLLVLEGGCGGNKFLYLRSDTGSGMLHQDNGGISITIELSKNSLVDNKLTIINRTSAPISIPRDSVVLEIPKRKLKVKAVKDFNVFCDSRANRLVPLCGASDFPYVCGDQIHGFYNSLKNKDFSYGTIKPRATVSGYMAFDMPLIVTNSKWATENGLGNASKQYKATVRFVIQRGTAARIVIFPLLVTCTDMDKLPYSVVKNLK